jgi:hypothetical protein
MKDKSNKAYKAKRIPPPEKPTVLMRHPHYSYAARIDECIAPLIQVLWDKGIDTTYSCITRPTGAINIRFANGYFTELFLSMASNGAPDEYSAHRIYGPDANWGEFDPCYWGYDYFVVKMEDRGTPESFENVTKGPIIVALEITVTFPREDLDWVTDAVLRWPMPVLSV